MENQEVINTYRLQSAAQSSHIYRHLTSPSSPSSPSQDHGFSRLSSESEKEEPFRQIFSFCNRFVILILAFLTGIFISNPFLGSPVRGALFEILFSGTQEQMYEAWEGIAYLSSIVYAFLIYWLMRHKSLEYLFVLASLLSSLSHFFYQYSFRAPGLVYLCAILTPFAWTFYAILPQRIATVWFYSGRRLQICAVLYLTINISIGAETNILRALGSLGTGKEFQQNFKEYSIAKGVIILGIALILYSVLRAPRTYPNAMGCQQIQPFRQGLRLTLCNPNFLKITGVECILTLLISIELKLLDTHYRVIMAYSQVLIFAALIGGIIVMIFYVPLAKKVVLSYKIVTSVLFVLIYLRLLLQHFYYAFEALSLLQSICYFVQYALCFELLYQILHPINPIYIASLYFVANGLISTLVQIYKLILDHTSHNRTTNIVVGVLCTLACLYMVFSLNPSFIF